MRMKQVHDRLRANKSDGLSFLHMYDIFFFLPTLTRRLQSPCAILQTSVAFTRVCVLPN